jgi:predicted metalloprotease with PDZ domain
MNKFKIVLLTLFVYASAYAADPYKYTVNLTKVSDDKIFVELDPPKIKQKEIKFYLPKIIPGTYAIADYGRMVSDLKALDKKGRELKVERLDNNTWKISNAKKIAKISYWVEDTYDSSLPGPAIFQPAGTNIEDGKNILINSAGFFGYFEGMKKSEFEINIIRDKTFYGATGLKASLNPPLVGSLSKDAGEQANVAVDQFLLEDYDKLVDSPLMYSEADTAIIRVANTDVLIASYSPNKMVSAAEIAESIKEVLEAQTKFLGGQLPVDKYAFVFYFTDQPVTSYGALEHSFSSIYYMPEQTIQQMNQQLRDFAAHEFFHIVTPLNIHSEEIENFDFNDPKMSQHLWLYEGMTEYFAGLVQVKNGLISEDQYLNVIRGKMINSTSRYNDNLPFTVLSKGTLDEHSNQYGNVYQKGALIGMALDINLRKLSDGAYSTQELMAELSQKYGQNAAFKDDELFDVITEMTFPEIGEFFKTYVYGETSLPYAEILKEVGIELQESSSIMTFSIGISNSTVTVVEVAGKNKIAIANENQLDEMGKALGLKDGDVILKINGEDLPDLGPGLGAFMQKHTVALESTETLTYTVLRDKEEVKLSAKVIQSTQIIPFLIKFDENATEAQLKLRKAWLEPVN